MKIAQTATKQQWVSSTRLHYSFIEIKSSLKFFEKYFLLMLLTLWSDRLEMVCVHYWQLPFDTHDNWTNWNPIAIVKSSFSLFQLEDHWEICAAAVIHEPAPYSIDCSQLRSRLRRPSNSWHLLSVHLYLTEDSYYPSVKEFAEQKSRKLSGAQNSLSFRI